MTLKDKNDIKIFILYLLRHINYPLDFSAINDIVVQDEFVGYFDFAECFAELLDTGSVEEVGNENGETLYMITERGIHIADNLQSNLLGIIRTRSLKSALRRLSFEKSGARLICESEDNDDGGYLLTCGIEENGSKIMEVKISVDDKNSLEKMKYIFNDRPEVIYRGITALLTGDVKYLLE